MTQKYIDRYNSMLHSILGYRTKGPITYCRGVASVGGGSRPYFYLFLNGGHFGRKIDDFRLSVIFSKTVQSVFEILVSKYAL
jgi:hypothetical protein